MNRSNSIPGSGFSKKNDKPDELSSFNENTYATALIGILSPQFKLRESSYGDIGTIRDEISMISRNETSPPQNDNRVKRLTELAVRHLFNKMFSGVYKTLKW